MKRSGVQAHPFVYELNARTFIKRISEGAGRKLTLGSVPPEEWDHLAEKGFDAVWLMGVWRRSPGGREKALQDKRLRQAYDDTLPGWTDDDVGGSPYAIHSYTVDHALGTDAELSDLKSQLNAAGLKLILDFVPNHLAYDHPWVFLHPDRFVQAVPGARTDLSAYFSHDGRTFFAHGKDPYFPAWTDTVQINHFSPQARSAMIAELAKISKWCDGVRCDMAMLLLNDVFERLWPDAARGLRPAAEFWDEAIPRIKKKNKDFLFIAEAYWGMESKLLAMGFDYVYDKSVYDSLAQGDSASLKRHLEADAEFVPRGVHFIENHDEDRASDTFGTRQFAAAIAALTLPGMRLVHDGQIQGYHRHFPIQLAREPQRAQDLNIRLFYDRLLAILANPVLREGKWSLLPVLRASEEDPASENLLAWSWKMGAEERIIVVNYSGHEARGRIRIPVPGRPGGSRVFYDELHGRSFLRKVDEAAGPGLYIKLDPWQSHLFSVSWKDTDDLPGISGRSAKIVEV